MSTLQLPWKAANPAPNPLDVLAALQSPWEASELDFPAPTFVFPPQMMNVLLFPPQPPALVVVWTHESAPGIVWDCCVLQVPLLSSRLPNSILESWILRRDGVGALLPKGDTSLSLRQAGSWKRRYFNPKAS